MNSQGLYHITTRVPFILVIHAHAQTVSLHACVFSFTRVFFHKFYPYNAALMNGETQVKVLSMNTVKRSALLAMLLLPTLLFSLLSVWSEVLSEEEWYRIFGGSGEDRASSVDQTGDGGYVFAGMTMSSGAGYSDVWLVKTDSEGNLVWNTTYGTTVYDQGFSVKQTTDGGYVVVGYCNNKGYGYASHKPWLIKTNENGEMEWHKTFNETFYEGVNQTVVWGEGHSVKQTIDGGFIITGVVQPRGDRSAAIWLIKTDAFGNKIWDRVFHGGGVLPYCAAYARSLQQTTDGGYIVAGRKQSVLGGNGDIWLIKVDMDGTVTWNRTFGKMYEDYSGDETAFSVRQTSDGGYIVAGNSYSSYDFRGWVIKTDALGEQVWELTLETSNSTCAAQQTADGKYMIFGHTPGAWYSGCVRLIKVDENGGKLWEKLVEDLPHCASRDGLQTSDGGYVVVGGYCPGLGDADVALVYVNGLIHNLAVADVAASKSVIGQGYPVNLSLTVLNQGNYTENFNVTVYVNATAILTQTITLNNCSSTSISFVWNTTSFAKGTYVLKAVADAVPRETNQTDNIFIYGNIFVTVPGDVDGDCDVDIYDIVSMSGAYGSKIGDEKFIANCDLDGDADIDIYDIVIASGNYAESW